jgi:hypothetical protein
MALTTWAAFVAAQQTKAYQAPHAILLAKGVGSNEIYFLEVDPATGALPVTATVTFPVFDFGATASAPRMAAVLGNTLGGLDYNTGAATAQTPRIVLATRHEAAATPVAFRNSNGTNFTPFDTGASDATTPRIVLATRHEAAATPVATRAGNGANFNAYDSGASDATTPRTVLATRHEAAATPLAVRMTVDGSNFITALPVSSSGSGSAWLARLDFSSTSVGAASYVQLVAATANACSRLRVFFSGNSGDGIILATGAGGGEVDQLYIPPGGSDTDYMLTVAASARISLKSLNGTNSTGLIIITALK